MGTKYFFLYFVYFSFLFPTLHLDHNFPSLSSFMYLPQPRSTPQFPFRKEQSPREISPTKHNKLYQVKVQTLMSSLSDVSVKEKGPPEQMKESKAILLEYQEFLTPFLYQYFQVGSIKIPWYSHSAFVQREGTLISFYKDKTVEV